MMIPGKSSEVRTETEAQTLPWVRGCTKDIGQEEVSPLFSFYHDPLRHQSSCVKWCQVSCEVRIHKIGVCISYGSTNVNLRLN